MRYPDSMLSGDESVVFDVHHDLFVLWKPIFFFCAFLAAWLALVLLLKNTPGWLLYAGLSVLLALALWMAWEVQVWTHANLVLTDHRLIYRTGVFSRRSREVPLLNINNVSFIQLISGRMFGMGDLVVETASEYGPMSFFYVPDPERLKMQVLEQMRKSHEGKGEVAIQKEVAQAVERHQPTFEMPPLPQERPPLYSEIVDQIERLDAMRERGVLSQEEFHQAKNALLDRLAKGDNGAG